ncbi:MAG: UDP-N-acetylmuramoyl-L-alanine--D-glutamate ligase [Planctomycetes bacterium]|nr:UDP-N-acetylmuramoyl-L-alanine--D-glutamate ligase [Planctomycetota bacterium]
MNLHGQRVLVLGLGLQGGGVGLTRFLVQRGARVHVTDLRGENDLRDSLDALRSLPVTFTLGRHDEADLDDVELVVANPAVPPRAPFLQTCRSRGLRIRNEIDLLIDALPQRAVAITGTNGKSTTTTMIHHVLNANGVDAHLGGNIGTSLLESAASIPDDAVLVVETSSYQLETLAPSRPWPDVAVWTNLDEDHLSRHGTMEDYARAKARLFASQAADAHAILNGADPWVRRSAEHLPGRRTWIAEAPGDEQPAFFEREGTVFERCVDEPSTPLLNVSDLHVRGTFQGCNAMLAIAAARALGVPATEAANSLRTYRGLPHRIEELGTYAGRRVIDNGVSTLPATTSSALEALRGEPIVLLCGGRSKGVSLDDLARVARATCRAVLTFGEAHDEFGQALESAGLENVQRHASLEDAVAALATTSRPGDVILFSPAGSSFDAYRNFQERVAAFRALVAAHLGAPQ